MTPLRPHIDDLLELRHQAHTLGLASHHPVNSALCGLYTSVFRGQGMDFEEVREYQEGDEIRNMDWRVTARTGVCHLKVFREERQRSVILSVDIGPHMQFGTRGTFKSIQASRAAALLGWAASAGHDRVGGLLFGDPAGLRYFRPSREHRAMWRLLHSLTDVCEEGENSSAPLLQALDKLLYGSPTGALLFIIADFNRDLGSLEQRLGRLRQRHEMVLMPIDDPADWEIADMGRVVFSARDGSRLEVDTGSSMGRSDYQRRWEERRRYLQLVCKRLSIDLLPIMTGDDVHKTLLDGLRRRMKHTIVR